MSPTRVGIDLAQIPLRVGGFVLGKFLVVEGTKGVKICGSVRPKTEELSAALNDARDVIKSYFGAADFDAAIIVVTNYTNHLLRQKMISDWQDGQVNITDMMDERLAVSVAYIDKAKPSANTRLVIISLSADILDVSVMSVAPDEHKPLKYAFHLRSHVEQPKPVEQESGSHSGGGLFGIVAGAVKTVADQIELASGMLQDVWKSILLDNNNTDDRMVLVLVGKAARSEKLVQTAKDVFATADEMWTDAQVTEDMAAYGAAVLSYYDVKIEVISHVETI